MIWLIGNKGMLGTELSLLFESRGIAHTGTDREVDITDVAALEAFAANQVAPITWIVNCAAYTAVDKAEDDTELCRRLNTNGPANIAQTAKKIGARLIHISTDYVFNGKGVAAGNPPALRPYREDDPTDPIGVYGLTKRDGEIRILESSPASYIIRTAWLYGKHGNNFVHTMLRLMNEKDSVAVVNDQRGSPTWAYDLSGVIADLICTAHAGRHIPYGIYHFSNEGSITWFDFAREIYEQGRNLGLISKSCVVKPCTSAEFPAKVTRPAYSVLNKTKLRSVLRTEIPTWDESLIKYLNLKAREQGLQNEASKPDVRWKQRFENYKNSLRHLTKLVNSHGTNGYYSEIEQIAGIKLFETTLELSWKVMKDYLAGKGFKGIIGSRDAIRYALNNGIIDDGELWFDMIDSRNETAHEYNEVKANELCAKIINQYHDAFVCFTAKMETLL